MASERVKLLGAWASPFVLRARVALNIKSVQYEFIDENVWAYKSDLLLKSNPVYNRVPVLFHGERPPLCESRIIVEYVDDVWSSEPSIVPTDPYDRAVARFWATYIDATWFPNIQAFLLGESEEVKQAAVKNASEGLALLEDAFITCSEGRTFFGGERLGYLDITVGCFLAWIRVVEKMANASMIDEVRTPNLFRWAQYFSTHTAVKDVLPTTDKLLKFAEYLINLLKG